MAIPLQSASQFLNLTSNLDSNPSIHVDVISYLLDVYETVFMHQLSGLPPIQKSIRNSLLKKLLIDHANFELMNRNISNFEELNDFTLVILKRCGLIT